MGVFCRKEESTMNTLKDVKCGQTVRVAKLTGEGALRRRIMDMGLTKGTTVYVRGYELSIRKGDAENILVE